MPETTVNAPSDLLAASEALMRWSRRLLEQAPFDDEQRRDMQAIYEASCRFYRFARAEMPTIHLRGDADELQRVRHELRNHINIVVGFSRLMVKNLPDNLLLHMALVRRIYETGSDLRTFVDELR